MDNLVLEITNAALLTIIIEVPIFYICGYKKASQLLTFALVNYVSNTLLNDALPAYTASLGYWTKLCIGELLVIAFEYAFMLHVISEDKNRLLKTICLTNIISIILGLVLLFNF